MQPLTPQVQLTSGPGFEAERIRYPAGAPFIPRHRHGRYQISSCAGGVGDYRYRGAVHRAPADSVQVFQPDEAHAYLPVAVAPGGGDYRVLYVDPTHLGTVARGELDWNAPVPPVFPDPILSDPALAAGFRGAHAALFDPDVPPLERETRLLLVLVELLQTTAPAGAGPDPRGGAGPTAGEHAAVRRARNFLTARATEKVSLAELSRAAGLSAFRLNRLFTARWGLPPHAFQLQLRVDRARGALGRGEPPAMVAADHGFVDQAHLHRVFKRLVGVTPGQYAQGGKNVQD